MKFVCDNTVGKLVRLLRMAGLDAAYVPENDVPAVVSLSREQDRKIISRNSRYTELVLASDFYHVEKDQVQQQFRRLVADLDIRLEPEKFLSRCLACNLELVRIDREEVRDRVYPYVWKTQSEYHTCPGCGRIYWPATHAQAMADRLLQLKAEIDLTSPRRPG